MRPQRIVKFLIAAQLLLVSLPGCQSAGWLLSQTSSAKVETAQTDQNLSDAPAWKEPTTRPAAHVSERQTPAVDEARNSSPVPVKTAAARNIAETPVHQVAGKHERQPEPIDPFAPDKRVARKNPDIETLTPQQTQPVPMLAPSASPAGEAPAGTRAPAAETDGHETAPPPRVMPQAPPAQQPHLHWAPVPQRPGPEMADPRQPRYKYYDLNMPQGAPDSHLKVDSAGNYLSLTARNAPLSAVLSLIAQQHGLNIIIGQGLESTITVTLHEVPLHDALDTILSVAGCSWVQQRNVILVSKLDQDAVLGPMAQDRQVRVIQLNFAAAADVEKIVSGIISPVGKVFIHETNSTDKRRTQEKIVVEDLPDYLDRIERYVASIDTPPRQVLIEAHILKVGLDDSTRHGVDLSYLTSVNGAAVSLGSQGLADKTAEPALVLTIDGMRLHNVVEAIKSTTDAKTLASPKVLVLNGQEAKIQIGEQLGFLVTTTTQTSTLQNVQFLDVGIVLHVTPQISDDGRILMQVKPEISTGTVNQETKLPDKETTEVDTSVMLPDGHGIVIGGLIQETDTDQQSKLIGLGDVRYIGRLFQRRTLVRDRSEIIIALTARIVPYDDCYRGYDQDQYYRATSPLLTPTLQPEERSEPQLFDARHNPRPIARGRRSWAPLTNETPGPAEPVPAPYYSGQNPPPMENPTYVPR